MTYEKSFIHKLNDANEARQLKWDATGDLDIVFHALEFVGEAGELGNKVKKLYRDSRGLKGSKVSMDDIKEEIADSLITLSKLVNEIENFTGEKIDIEYETIKKFNSVSEKNGFDVKLDFELKMDNDC